jgi:hypothetical protein
MCESIIISDERDSKLDSMKTHTKTQSRKVDDEVFTFLVILRVLSLFKNELGPYAPFGLVLKLISEEKI